MTCGVVVAQGPRQVDNPVDNPALAEARVKLANIGARLAN